MSKWEWIFFILFNIAINIICQVLAWKIVRAYNDKIEEDN